MLTPNAELAAALTDALERHHLAAGHALWQSPRIRDFAGWLRQSHAGRLLTHPDLPRTLGEVEERELWRAVVEASPAARELLDPAGAARAARRARHAMAEYGIPEAALRDHHDEETSALLQWSRLFDGRCRELDCLPADRLLGLAPPPDAELRWIDSDQWRPVARRWLMLHAGAPLRPAAGAPAAPRRVEASSPRAELAAIASWAAEHLSRDGDFRAWICIADLPLRRREVEDAFDALLAPQRWRLGGDGPAPYAVAGGTPLADQAPVKAALALLSAAAGTVSFESFSALLRAPELAETSADPAAAAALDLELRRRGPHEAPLRDWLRLAGALQSDDPAQRGVPAVQRLGAAFEVLETVHGAQRMSRWVGLWVEAFECGPWALRQHWSSGEFQAAERLRELLATLATADAVFGPAAFGAAVRLLVRAARDTAFQPQTGIPPIWISGRVMDPWLPYDGLWLAGFADDRWPPRVDPLPLIPLRIQRAHGVPEADPEAQLGRALDLQQRWQTRGAQLVASAAAAADGRAGRLSPLLPAAAAIPAAARSTQPTSAPPSAPHAAPADPPPSHWLAQRQAPPRLESLIDEQAPVFAPPETLRGVATLRAQSLCPFRGFAETRLGTGPLERPGPGFNGRERGEMLHAALEQIWTELRDSECLAATAPAELAALTAQAALRAVERQCRKRDPGAPWQARERRRLATLLDRWLELERRRPPFAVATLEGAARVARHGGLEFNVRIDRIDVLAEGGRVLIDYKTGAASPDWRGDRPDNPQLPVYALLQPEDLVAVAYGRVNARDCGFIAEAARGGIFKPGARPTSLEGMPNFPALLELWSQRLDVIAREFAAGLAAAAPTARACVSCRLQPLCRIPAATAGADPDETAVAPEAVDG